MERVRLGIIGFGNMGTGHFKNIMKGKCPDIVVTAVADKKPERLELIEKLYNEHGGAEWGYPVPKAYLSAEELIKSGDVDAILVAVPHYDHPTYTIMGFQNGLHVMCEKPAGVYTLQVREMIEEANKHPELVFGMMFNQRTTETFRKMKEIVDSGELGQIKRTNWIITTWYRPQSYYNSGDWRATWKGEGGGVLLNQCPHNLDLWQWICGMPVKVDAKLHCQRSRL